MVADGREEDADDDDEGGVEEDADEEGLALVLDGLFPLRHHCRHHHIVKVQYAGGNELFEDIQEKNVEFSLGALEDPFD